MKRKELLRVFVLLFILLTLSFIWSRSMKSRAESAAESAAVGAFLTPFLEWFVGEGNVTDHLVRKLAHFCEFGLLGVETALWFSLREKHFRFPFGAALGFLAAAVDETIQLFVGRGSQFSDVLLDFCGFVCGMIGLRLLFWLKRKSEA